MERTRDNRHKREDAKLDSCRCPQCEARDALKQIMEYEAREFVKVGGGTGAVR